MGDSAVSEIHDKIKQKSRPQERIQNRLRIRIGVSCLVAYLLLDPGCIHTYACGVVSHAGLRNGNPNITSVVI